VVYLDLELIAKSVPQIMVDQYLKDFEELPGSEKRDDVLRLRRSILDVTQCVWDHPELMRNPDYVNDLHRVLAMREAMRTLGVFYDA
jgi:hypothetical protein